MKNEKWKVKLEQIAAALGVDTPELFTTETVVFMPAQNKSIERMYQDIMDDFDKFKKSIAEKIKSLQWEWYSSDNLLEILYNRIGDETPNVFHAVQPGIFHPFFWKFKAAVCKPAIDTTAAFPHTEYVEQRRSLDDANTVPVM